MNIRTLLLATLLFGVHPLLAQDEAATSSGAAARQEAQQQQTQQQEHAQDRSDIPFVDEDGDGINDNVRLRQRRDGNDPASGQLRQRRRDHFIDNDGDGINDNRCGGMGIMQGKRRGQQKEHGK